MRFLVTLVPLGISLAGLLVVPLTPRVVDTLLVVLGTPRPLGPEYDDEDVDVEPDGVRPDPRVLTLETPLVDLVVVSAFRRFSSAFRARASLCCCASSSLRSASCCFIIASFSMSAMSCVAPCHEGFKISLWFCSVRERIRVHVFSSVSADCTVLETVY